MGNPEPPCALKEIRKTFLLFYPHVATTERSTRGKNILLKIFGQFFIDPLDKCSTSGFEALQQTAQVA